MEPTKDMRAEERLMLSSPPSEDASTIAVDTDFCDSLLNSVPDRITCGSELVADASSFDSDSLSMYTNASGGGYVNSILPDFDAVDLDSMDLESFLSIPIPLTC